MQVKEKSEKVGLKFNIQKTKIMASDPITSWQIDGETGEIDRETGEIDGETVETVSHFFWGGSKITADGDCSHEIKRCLLLGRKVMTNLDSILKSRDITWPTKVRLVKAMVFPVVMYGCESWTVKKAERQEFMPLNCGVGSPCSPRDSQESSPTPQFKSINSSALSFLYSPTLTSIHDYWKNIGLVNAFCNMRTVQTFTNQKSLKDLS